MDIVGRGATGGEPARCATDPHLLAPLQALHVEDLVGPGLDLAAAPTDALPHLCVRQWTAAEEGGGGMCTASEC